MKRAVFLLAVGLTSCGGGGSVTPGAPSTMASPTQSPSSIVASTTSVAFSSGSAQNFTVSESGYAGSFTESDTCNPYAGRIATVVSAGSSSGSQTYTVTPDGAGTCEVTVRDTQGNSVAISVTVTVAAITVQ